jgi:hypothetical protein
MPAALCRRFLYCLLLCVLPAGSAAAQTDNSINEPRTGNYDFLNDNTPKDEGTPEDGSPEHPLIGIEHMPEFPGGKDSLNVFLAKNLHYPQKDINGRIYLRFIVGPEGDVLKPEIVRSNANPADMDAEVMRVISLMPRWKPGIYKGKPVHVWYYMLVKLEELRLLTD